MFELVIKIETENPAFDDGSYYDEIRDNISKLLEQKIIERGAGEYILHDSDGNKVGSAIIKTDGYKTDE